MAAPGRMGWDDKQIRVGAGLLGAGEGKEYPEIVSWSVQLPLLLVDSKGYWILLPEKGSLCWEIAL